MNGEQVQQAFVASQRPSPNVGLARRMAAALPVVAGVTGRTEQELLDQMTEHYHKKPWLRLFAIAAQQTGYDAAYFSDSDEGIIQVHDLNGTPIYSLYFGQRHVVVIDRQGNQTRMNVDAIKPPAMGA